MTFYTGQIFQDGCSILSPNNCALIIGLTYFISAIAGLLLKNLANRKLLLLFSMLSMALSQIGLGVYFFHISKTSCNSNPDTRDVKLRWLPLPLMIMFTAAYNVGVGSLTLDIASEILPSQSKSWTLTLANVASNLTWFIVTKTFHNLQEDCGLFSPFLLYGVSSSIGFLFVALSLPSELTNCPSVATRPCSNHVSLLNGSISVDNDI